MKKFKIIVTAISIVSLTLLSSCETNEVVEVREITEVVETNPNILFERRNINFSDTDNLPVNIPFPSDIEIFDTDLVLAYRMSGIDPASGTAIWEAMPQTIFGDLGTVTYNFNYSVNGIQVFLDIENGVDRIQLPNELIIDQTFQFAILPSQLNQSGKILNNNNFSYDKVSANATFIN